MLSSLWGLLSDDLNSFAMSDCTNLGAAWCQYAEAHINDMKCHQPLSLGTNLKCSLLSTFYCKLYVKMFNAWAKYIFESHRYFDTKAGCLISIIVHLDCGISRFVTAIITYSCFTLPPLAAWFAAWPQPRTRQFVIRERCRDVVTARTIAEGDIVPEFRGISQGVIKDKAEV